MKKNKLFLRWVAVFGVVMLFAVSGWAASPTYQAAGDVVSDDKAITPAWPAHQSGDIALLIVETDDGAATLTTAAGFTAVTHSPQNATGTRLSVFWARATSNSMANPTVGDSGNHQIAQIITFRGVIASGNPWDITAGDTSASDTSFTIPGATTTVNDTLIVAIVSNGRDSSSSQTLGWTNADLTSLAERVDNNTQKGNGGGFGVATGIKSTAGAYANTTGTLSNASVQGRMSIALKPLVPVSDLKLIENTLPNPAKAEINEDVNISVRASNVGTLDANASIDLNVTYNQDVNISSITSPSDFNCSITSGVLSAGTPINCHKITNFTVGLTKDFNFVVKATSYGDLIQTSVMSSASTESVISNNTLVSTAVQIAPLYCKRNGLGEGFHIIDPDGGSNANSYEIYCDMTSTKAPRELIALPLKNDYNNFVFNSDTLTSFNYYTQADAAKIADSGNEFSYLQISIALDGTINVVPESIAENSTNNSGYLSNLNLIGTPFYIDFANTTISHCDTNKLRIGSWDQAVKINSLDYTNARCKVENMQLKILDDYQYLKYSDVNNGNEILGETCREIFNTVPDAEGYLPTVGGESNGHFWVDPDKGGRIAGDHVDTLFRPIVAYCKYQEDIQQAWTFVMALDGRVTTNKSDIKTMAQVRADPTITHDTCSQLGLLFYVPNTKDTFDRTRIYLKDNKQQWINYTGTIEEKYKMYNNDINAIYYLEAEGWNEIWPYGPFGLYFPQAGDKNILGNTMEWGGTRNVQDKMSGRCMNSGSISGAAFCTDYTHTAVAPPDALSTPDDGTLSIMGWRTTLQDQVAGGLTGIKNGDQWWISDSGAGNYANLDCSGYNQWGCKPYYEPNGNYYKDNWLNFISDENGNVYHLDDNNGLYSYYDYMCAAWDNYVGSSRYQLVKGPFNVIEHDAVLSGAQYKEAPLATKIVNDQMRFDVVLLQNDLSDIRSDYDISAGIFLDDTIDDGATARNIWYFGQISDFNQTRFEIPAVRWPSGIQTWQKASKRLFFEFKYCANDSMVWTDCWDHPTGSTTATCKTGFTNVCKTANSNDFATRPNNFDFTLTSGGSLNLLKSGEEYNLSVHAYQYGSPNIDTPEYNQSKINLTLTITKRMPNDDLNATLNGTASFPKEFSFINGLSDSNASILYNDVGRIKVEISDLNWAAVDASDTPASDRFIMGGGNFTFIPYQFVASGIRIVDSRDGNFTYMSNDLNMSAKLDFNITSQNKQGVATKNFTTGLYEFPISVLPSIVDSVKGSANENNITSSTIGFTDGITHLSWNDANTSRVLKFNFDRNASLPINPLEINATEVNISISKTYIDGAYSALVENNTTNKAGTSNGTTGNAVFLYGRTDAPDYRFSNNPGCGRVWYEFYDTNGSDPLIVTTFGAMPALSESPDPNWYKNTLHSVGMDGNITATTVAQITVSTTTGCMGTMSGSGFEKRGFTYDGSFGYPFRGTVQLDASDWLDVTSNNFGVEFYKSSGWIGQTQKAKTATDSDTEKISNRRIMW